MRLLEVTKIRLDAAEEKLKLKDDRLAAKDERIRNLEGTVALRDEQLKLALSANQDRQQVNTGDARMLAACERQLSNADAEINRLRNPGFLKSLFDPKTLFSAGVGYGIGRLQK